MRKGYFIDHRILFLFGFTYYLLTPYFIGVGNFFEGFPGVDLYHRFFDQIPANKIKVYMIITVCWLIAFFAGHYTFQLFVSRRLIINVFPESGLSKSVPYLAPLLFLVLFIFIYFARTSILGNYTQYDSGARGKMSTLLILFNFFMVYLLVSKQKKSGFIFLGTIITSLILLLMGGRMYVFQTFIVFLMYKTTFSSKPWRLYHIAIFALTGLFIGSAFGLWRIGAALNLKAAAYSFFAEPAFTWISTSSFLINNDMVLLNWPANFLSSFVNLIPNTIISTKPYLVSLESMAVGYKNPLGADSAWSTFVINFGVIGSVIFIFCTGFMLNFLRHLSTTSRFWTVYYIMVCGLIPFQFFRDGFFILNKQLFFNFLILPGGILLSLKVLIWMQGKGSMYEAASQANRSSV